MKMLKQFRIMKQRDCRYGIGPFWNFVNRWNLTEKQIKRLVFYIEMGLTATEIFRLIKGDNNKTLAFSPFNRIAGRKFFI